jgi:DNA-binding GntR family transcriptional regulator
MASRIGPSYQVVADDLKARITANEFPVGSPIPSTAKLMEHYSVSSTVVRHAVVELQAAGIVIGHSGKAVFVQAQPSDVADEKETAARAADELAALRRTVGRLEAHLIDLYGKTGYEYPHDEDVAEDAARHERLA